MTMTDPLSLLEQASANPDGGALRIPLILFVLFWIFAGLAVWGMA